EFAGDLAIADRGEPSIMEEDEKRGQTQLVASDKLVGRSPSGLGATVPDFRGKSMRDVVEESSANGIEVTIEGSGVARAQLPLPGSPMRQGELIRIVFA